MKFDIHKNLPKNRVSVSDPRLTRREIYNPNKFEVIFSRLPDVSAYILSSGISLGPAVVRCPSEGRCILNHDYYSALASDGTDPFSVVTITGSDIGRGIKGPSRTE